MAEKATGAGQWRLFSIITQGALQFGTTVVLARLLPPEDFGLAALAAVIVGLATVLLDLSVGAAVVQVRPLTTRHVRASFTLALLFGASLTTLLFVVAPWLGTLLRNHALPQVLRAEAVLFLFSGVGVTARALLQRRLALKQLGFIELGSYTFGYAIAAIILALNQFGVWSLVAGALLQSLLANFLVIALVRHPIKPLWSGPETRQVLQFGTGGALNGTFAQLALHADNLITGRLLGTHALGIYARAYSLMLLPVGYAGNTLFSVLFPALSQLRSHRDRFANAYLMSVALITLVIAPVMAGMAVAAPHLILGLYGSRWAEATVPLQIFCAVGLFRVVLLPAGAVNLALGHVYAEMRRQVLYTIWVIAGSLIGARWGIVGVAVGVASAMLFKYFIMVSLSLRVSGSDWRQFLSAQLPGMSLAVLVGLVALGVRSGLEKAGAQHLMIFLGIAVACAVAVPFGVYLIPGTVRPRRLFWRLAKSAAPLPALVRTPLMWALRPRV